ncbi:uncharacterized protein LOC102290724 [Haplochromis burtoni]|uniref:uncharacterized protein LOC102290724 n=1 Tax=Haplochromis burtoni TaxID=8153 RepID=UPI001C2D363C|nr:uncharacterized protein LOC102290724 [Haplochromis burtoni]
MLKCTGVKKMLPLFSSYPLSAEKLTVAKSIITTFPSLSVRVAGQGEGFEHYYDPVSHCGFLETKLRNLRRNLDKGQRRYKKRKVTNDCGEDKKLRQEDGNTSSTDEWVTLIKRLRPSAENLPTIMSGMEETYTSRRAWISKDSPTAAEIFREYPRFLDMPSLLDLEFGKLTGGKVDLFLRKWEASIIPKLKSVAALETRMSSLLKDFEEKTEDEACYTALVVLTHLLPPVGASRCSLKSAITHLVDFDYSVQFSWYLPEESICQHLTEYFFKNLSLSSPSPSLEQVLHRFAVILKHHPQHTNPS